MEIKEGVSFVLPMFNEEENIGATIAKIKSVAKEITKDYEVVVVDDASTDASVKTVEALAREDASIKLFCLEKNTKFGGALARGLKEASKDVILYTDSDMPVTIDDIKASLPLIAEADIVTGYSKIKKGDTVKRKIISLAYNFIVRIFFGLDIKDINSGYKIVRKSAIEGANFISRSPFIDVELFLYARKRGCIVKQFPLIFIQRAGGKSYISRLPVILATFRDMIKLKIR